MNKNALEYGIKVGMLTTFMQVTDRPDNSLSERYSQLSDMTKMLIKKEDGLTIDNLKSSREFSEKIFNLYQVIDLDKYYGMHLGLVAAMTICGAFQSPDDIYNVQKVLSTIPNDYLGEESKRCFVSYLLENGNGNFFDLLRRTSEMTDVLCSVQEKSGMICEKVVFISYRREQGGDFAGRISDSLKAKGIQTFFDVDSMKSGCFDSQIFENIDKADAVLVILSPNALDRCVDENDWVRKEIKRALEKEKKIIPIFMNGFNFPNNLPEDIAKLPFYEGVTHSFELFSMFIDKLIQLIND